MQKQYPLNYESNLQLNWKFRNDYCYSVTGAASVLGIKTVSITWITPLEAWTSTAVILASELPEPSVLSAILLSDPGSLI